MGPHGKDIFTASVFRSKPEIDLGFLRGCYWKYSAKPSNIVAFREEILDDGTEDTDTIQKDVFVAGQDVAAGLVRMDILPRIYHLLETEPTAALEDSIISVTIAIARHYPKCTTAILKYPKFVQTIVKRFQLNKRMDVLSSQINSVRLLKVILVRSYKIILGSLYSFVFDVFFTEPDDSSLLSYQFSELL
jgi:hypothetical protein